MKHEIFDSMKGQLNPSLQAQADLRQALSKPAKVRAADSRRWAALAACACLMLTICGAVALQNEGSSPRQHSYTAVDGVFQPIAEQKNPIDGGGTEATTQTGGELPGGAVVGGGDVAVQAGAEAYDRLMQGMGMMEENAQYPDWYGGAYIGSDGGLTVLLVADKDPGDKSLELQVLEWTGDAGVAFSSAKYSHAYLSGLMDQLDERMPQLVEEGGWSLNTADNCIDLDILFPVDTKVLTALAELDPDDDAIRVSAYTEKAHQIQFELKPVEDAPTKVQLGEEPVPGGVMDTEPVPGGDVDGDPDGYDIPTYDASPAELPAEQSAPAHYDLLPLEDDPDALAIEPVDPGTDLNDLPSETVAPAQSIDLPAFTPNEE